MSVAQYPFSAPCRFRGEHPTITRPASSRLLVRVEYDRAGALCARTRRGLRASHLPRLRDTRYRRPAANNAPPRRDP